MATLPVNLLMQPHADYRADLIELHETLYEGGHRMRDALKHDHKGAYLHRRQLDNERIGDMTLRQLRVQKAGFASELGRIVGSLICSMFKKPPQIVASGPEAAFYNGLNADADGAGTPLAVILFKNALSNLLHHRGCLGAQMPEPKLYGGDFSQRKEAGDYDGRFVLYQAAYITDWGRDKHGRLAFVRIYACEDERPDGFRPPVARVHTWTYITQTAVTTYTFRQLCENGSLKPITDADYAVESQAIPHGYSRVPVAEMVFAREFWVADKLCDGQIKLFNSEADESWIRSLCAFPVACYSGDLPENWTVAKSPIHLLHFPAGGTFDFKSPAISDTHEKAIARERSDMYATLDAMALFLAAQSQNARQSADAKEMDSASSTNIIRMFADSEKAQVIEVLNMIREKRGDEATSVQLTGMDDIDGRPLMRAIQEATAFMGVNPPPSAKRYIVGKVALSACSDAPQSVREAIVSELDAATNVQEKETSFTPPSQKEPNNDD